MLGMRGDMQKSPISDADILIAATALKHNLVMVTENVQHFRRIPGLSIESWRV
jgi:tRNA(fMet)-specific endonuclease VapC